MQYDQMQYDPLATLCAQTNAQTDYVTLSRRSRLQLCPRRFRLFRPRY